MRPKLARVNYFFGFWIDQGKTLVLPELVEEIFVRILDLTDSTKSTKIGTTNAYHASGQISPDGRFVVYESDESGEIEIFVRELSETGGKWQVSNVRNLVARLLR